MKIVRYHIYCSVSTRPPIVHFGIYMCSPASFLRKKNLDAFSALFEHFFHVKLFNFILTRDSHIVQKVVLIALRCFASCILTCLRMYWKTKWRWKNFFWACQFNFQLSFKKEVRILNEKRGVWTQTHRILLNICTYEVYDPLLLTLEEEMTPKFDLVVK